ncbi:MAG: S1 RNA-binding domain-containing protein [Candidatus Omnitrophota bacterium]
MSELQQTRLRVGDTVEAEVFKITSFGAFVKLSDGKRALIHISQVADNFVKNINDYLKLGDVVKARILNIEADKIDLTLKKPKDETVSYPKGKEFKSTFEDKLEGFLNE